jgi:hypothetical protein
LIENCADDDNYLSKPTSAELGDIKLQIYEITVTGSKPFTYENALPASEPDKIHERSKKAIGHCFG